MNRESQTKTNPQQGRRTLDLSTPHARLAVPITALLFLGVSSFAQSEGGTGAESVDLAYRLQNPLAFIPRLPIENQFDFGYGSENAMRYALRPRPVIPFSLGDDLSLITRTTFNVVYQEAPEPGSSDKFGLGDTDLELYLSPKYKAAGGWAFGAGPVLRFPTATDELLGGEKWGAGPGAAVLRQSGRWTYGLFVNHLWDYAGASDRGDLNATFLQPVLSYTTESSTTFGVDTQSTYDWSGENWTVPINLTVSQLVKLGGQAINLTVGGRYYAERPVGGPDWGMQFSVNFIFAK